MNKKFDAILVLGRGINKDGQIPDSAKAGTKKAVELWKNGLADIIIFSGKWTYVADFVPPVSEAKAMSDYAITLGLNPEKAILEDQSETTVTNLCEVKKILLAKNCHSIAFISIDILEDRMRINADMVFGDQIEYTFFRSDFTFPEPKNTEIRVMEEKKLNGEVKEFFKNITRGDDKTIFEIAQREIDRRKSFIKQGKSWQK